MGIGSQRGALSRDAFAPRGASWQSIARQTEKERDQQPEQSRDPATLAEQTGRCGVGIGHRQMAVFGGKPDQLGIAVRPAGAIVHDRVPLAESLQNSRLGVFANEDVSTARTRLAVA